MRKLRSSSVLTLSLSVLLLACGGGAPEPAPAADAAPAAAPKAEPADTQPASSEPASTQPASSEPASTQPAPADGAVAATAQDSEDILTREPVTDRADVLHVLVGWGELAPAYRGSMDPRAKERSKADADALALDILDRAREGEDFRALMKEYSEDPGSAQRGNTYEATPQAGLVPPFKNLSLRLNVGEVGLVETRYGWHVIKRDS